MNLSRFQRPSRYINHEVNAVHRKAQLRVALAFPDIYDVGMSHLGLRILYDIINRLPYAAAERVFAPWLDLGDYLKTAGRPLCSLESNAPLSSFDVIGFSLQYELSFPTVLRMLSLGGMPIRSEDRLAGGWMPLVIAGGPCTVNPMPMARFIDAFLIGDGEEAVPEILDACRRWKEGGSRDRMALLRELSGIAGVFVPLCGSGSPVRRRYLASLDASPFPEGPIVPYTAIIHDRVNIEISRGCTMGCRFCQAGMIYRPIRERSPETVLRIADEALAHTGYDAVSFTSLSSGDYTCLVYLMQEFNRRFSDQRVSLSLPSLRVGSVSKEMLRELKTVRKSGFTMAPEAGTDRLRRVVNKDFSEEDYLRALDVLFAEGWQTLKLYFMTGLPTETTDDIEAIPEMVRTAIRLSKKFTGRHVTINVGVSSFVPKPHTPFQWYGQATIEYLRETNARLKKALLRKGVHFKGHREEMSLLEAVFARGDARLADLLEEVHLQGSSLDAWTEAFDYSRWQAAAEKSGIDLAEYATRSYSEDSALPWDAVDSGVSRRFLWQEYEKALSSEITKDCRMQCLNCGLGCRPLIHLPPETPAAGSVAESRPAAQPAAPHLRVRIEFTKLGPSRYLAHLELMTALIRAMRRAGFPFRYSAGFHPAPRVSYGPALSVGIAGAREYLDIELLPPFDVTAGVERLNRTLPEGIKVLRAAAIGLGERSLTEFIVRYAYELKHPAGLSDEKFRSGESLVIQREKGPVDLRQLIDAVEQRDAQTVHMTLSDTGAARARIDEITRALFGHPAADLEITRLNMRGWQDGWRDPIEGERQWAAKY